MGWESIEMGEQVQASGEYYLQPVGLESVRGEGGGGQTDSIVELCICLGCGKLWLKSILSLIHSLSYLDIHLLLGRNKVQLLWSEK
jgi:hypothetical protein